MCCLIKSVPEIVRFSITKGWTHDKVFGKITGRERCTLRSNFFATKGLEKNESIAD
jgi:hypothetical protein